jgi:hypothetical protein
MHGETVKIFILVRRIPSNTKAYIMFSRNDMLETTVVTLHNSSKNCVHVSCSRPLWWFFFILLNNQRDAALSSRIYSSLQGYSTCFGCFLRPSSGVLIWPWHSETDFRPRTSFNEFKPQWHMNCTYDCICSFNCTPDDGCRKQPKHVE